MRSFNIHFAKTHLSRLIDEVERGESFVIAKAGTPKVKVVPFDLPPAKGKRRLGALQGVSTVPRNFKRMFAREIGEMFQRSRKRRKRR